MTMYEDEKAKKELKRLQNIPDNKLSEEEFLLKNGLLTDFHTKGGIPPCHC